jgi:dCTP deaminase
MALSNEDIKKCIKNGSIRFTPKLSDDQIGSASVDLTLDSQFSVFKKKYGKKTPVDLEKTGFIEATFEVKADSITIPPGGMCLGVTREKIKLAPNIIGTLEGRSRYARMGLAVHVTSAMVQPGSDNHQVLEIVNLAPFPVTIHSGMRISQVLFSYLESDTTKPYAKFGKIARRQ